MSRTITVTAPQIRQPKRRATWMVRLGLRLHPQSVTDEWYASECDPDYAPESLRVLLQWQIACLIRGARK